MTLLIDLSFPGEFDPKILKFVKSPPLARTSPPPPEGVYIDRCIKQILMRNWHLIEKQPLLSEIYKKLRLVSYKRGRSLKDILVRAKL